jgi:hypothetical protein
MLRILRVSCAAVCLVACSQLSENVIKVLRAMHCPHPLQANQIQGSDFSAMYPVIQWLVKKVCVDVCVDAWVDVGCGRSD